MATAVGDGSEAHMDRHDMNVEVPPQPATIFDTLHYHYSYIPPKLSQHLVT